MVPTYKYLGITLDSTLTFNYHVKTVVNTIAKANLLAKVCRFMNKEVAVHIYKSMILPYFDYGDVIYNSASQDILQIRCFKICKNLNIRHDTEDLHTITKMPMLADRRKAHVNNFVHARTNNVVMLDTRNIRTRAHDAPLFRINIPKNEAYWSSTME